MAASAGLIAAIASASAEGLLPQHATQVRSPPRTVVNRFQFLQAASSSCPGLCNAAESSALHVTSNDLDDQAMLQADLAPCAKALMVAVCQLAGTKAGVTSMLCHKLDRCSSQLTAVRLFITEQTSEVSADSQSPLLFDEQLYGTQGIQLTTADAQR